MSQYVITIAPVGGDGDDLTGPVSQAVVQIDGSTGEPSVRELTVRAPDGGALTGQIPFVQFDLLLQAFLPPNGSRRRAVVRPPAPVEESTSRVATIVNAAPSRRTTSRANNKLHAGRAYRRAPQPEELEAAYEETGTISGVASHFGVPVHTAQGWISRMRRKNPQVAAG